MDAHYWIEGLELIRHPEGGYYREAYRSGEFVAQEHLPGRFSGDRSFSTAIYYLLNGNECSVLHRIRQDEVWHFYAGSPLSIHVIDPSGTYSVLRLGRDLRAGQRPQGVVFAGCYFGATVDEPKSYSLLGCTVAPGFNFADFELPRRRDLCTAYPQHQSIIEKLTR